MIENLNKRTSQLIANQYGSLAEAIVARQYEEQPELYTRLGEALDFAYPLLPPTKHTYPAKSDTW